MSPQEEIEEYIRIMHPVKYGGFEACDVDVAFCRLIVEKEASNPYLRHTHVLRRQHWNEINDT